MYYSIDGTVGMKMIEHAINRGMIYYHTESEDEMMIMNDNVMMIDW